MSRIRSNEGGVPVDAYSSSLIFGSAQKSPSLTHQQTTTPGTGYYGGEFVLDGSGGSKRMSPGGSLRPSPGMVPYGTDTITPGRSPNHRLGGFTPQQHGPPIQSMLERNSTGHSPMFGRSPAPPVTAGQSPFFGSGLSTTSPYGAGGSVSRPITAMGVGWGSSSRNGQSDSLTTAAVVGGSSSSATAAGLCYEDLEAMWRVWVIVSGFPSSETIGDTKTASAVQVLLQLQRYGDVVEHVAGRGNWHFFKFSSPYEAERAATECPLLPLNPTAGGGGGGGSLVMLTVTRLTADLARTLDFHFTTHVHDPSSSRQGGSTSSRGGHEGGHSQLSSRSPRLVPCDDPDAMNHGGLMRRSKGQDSGGGAGMGISGAGPRSRAQTLTTRADPQLMAQYLRPIKRGKSICEQILDYFFA